MTNEEIKKMIVEELKNNGLEIGEDAAVMVVKALFNIVPKIVLATDNKIDDLLIAILPLIERPIMAALDKIDGVEGK